MNADKLRSFFNKIWPYLIILIASILGTYLVFYTGLIKGHDYKFHVGNVIEQFETIKASGHLSPISGLLAMGLGSGTRLYYAPLPHLIVSLFAFIFNDIFISFKFILVLSIIISGFLMYRFAMHFTNNNKIASLISSIVFVIYPYRLLDAFVRFAWAETLAIGLLPLFFMGLYDICHVKERKEYGKAFLEVVIGASLLFLVHNLTAFYSYILGFIYLLCNIHLLIKLFKDSQYWTYIVTSIFLIVSISAVSLFSQIELLDSKLYGVSDPHRMWTDLESVIKRVPQWKVFSGFISIDNLSYWFANSFTSDSLILGICFYVFGCVLAIVLDKILSNVDYVNKFSYIISIGVLFAVISIFGRRIEIYFAAIIFALVYAFIKYIKLDDNTKDRKDKFYKNPLLYYSIAMFIVLMIMITCKWPWQILPEAFLKIQFPWRLWGIVQLFISIIVGLIIKYFDFKKLTACLGCVAASLLLVVNNPLVDKRSCFENKYDETWVSEIDYGLLDMGGAIGFNKEYIPLTLLDINYQSKYSNSLHSSISRKISYNFDKYEDYMYDPVILDGTGEGNINVIDAFSPTFNMKINITSEEALIQMPLVYYPGYRLELLNTTNDRKTYANGINVDGLVAFHISKGNYVAYTRFKGSKARNAGLVLTYTGITLTSLTIIYVAFFDKKVRAKLENKKDKIIEQ